MKQQYQKSSLLIIAMLTCMKSFAITFSQTSKGEDPQQKPFLALKYYDIPENKYEKMFLSAFLENYSTSNSEELEIATKEAHKFFIEHQEEILTEIKVNELIELHEIGKRIRKERKARFRAEMWAPLLSALPGIVSNATIAGLNAGQQQQQQYQQKLNRDKEIQAFLAQNSSKPSYKEYQQDFGSVQNTNTKSSYRRVTTSNGFDEPLPSASVSNTPQQDYSNIQNSNNRRVTTSNGFDEPSPSAPASIRTDNIGSINAGERTIHGVFVYNSLQTVVRLRYFNGQITAYSTSRDALNREQWISIYPDTPHPTMEIQDGNLARDYKYKVSGDGKVFLFNL